MRQVRFGKFIGIGIAAMSVRTARDANWSPAAPRNSNRVKAAELEACRRGHERHVPTAELKSLRRNVGRRIDDSMLHAMVVGILGTAVLASLLFAPCKGGTLAD